MCSTFEKSALNLQVQADVKEASDMEFDEKYKLNLKKNINYKRNVFVQFFWLFWRNLLVQIRDPLALRIQFISTLVHLEFN